MRLKLISILSMASLLCLCLTHASNEVSAGCGGEAENEDGLIGSANPAAVYCIEMGYEYAVTNEPSGQRGICILPDGTQCDAWAFLQGKCGQSYSYCERCGYSIQTVGDGKNPFSREYAVCVSNEGKQMGSVTELMALDEKVTKASVRSESPESARMSKQPSKKVQIPPSFDWRDYQGHDWMTPVKDQGSCGSCWAFGPVGVLEAMYNIWRNDPDLDFDLSEQYLVSDCYLPGSCCGGSYYTILQFLCLNGIPDEDCLPYVDGLSCTCRGYTCDENCEHSAGSSCSDAACSDRCPDWQNRLTGIDSAEYIAMGEVYIKEYVASTGPLTLAMGMGLGVGYWDGDIYRCTDDSRTNHVVVIVGYDDEGGYWIVKNSYGVGFGDDGYFKLGYGECGIESTALSYHFMDQPDCGCIIAHSTVLDHFIMNCRDGLTVGRDNVIVDCDGHLIAGTRIGILALDKDGIVIRNCNITGFGFGIVLDGSSNSTLTGNAVYNNRTGIELFGSGSPDPGWGNHLLGNTLSGNSKYGIRFYNSSNNHISGNRLVENACGVCLDNSSQFNTVWANQFTDNAINALEDARSTNNRWNLENVGNCWSDFESNPGYPDWYQIPGEGGGVDYYPKATPKAVSLAQNYPNPFNPSTAIEYALPRETWIRITIYNIIGEKVRTLVNERQSAGRKRIVWDSKTDEGDEVASGIYFYQIKAGEFTQSKKMVVLK
jgi:parallel beta-helix repeat protein